MTVCSLASAGIGFGTLVSVIYRDATKLLMSHDIEDATCLEPSLQGVHLPRLPVFCIVEAGHIRIISYHNIYIYIYICNIADTMLEQNTM